MKKILIILILNITFFNIKGQLLSTNENKQYFAANIVSSGIISGFGSAIHKHKYENFGHAFINGFWKGCTSGTLNVLSKEILSVQAQKNYVDWRLCWSSKIINSFSNTIQYNAINNNKNLLQDYSINIGFIKLSINNKIQIEPVSLISFIYLYTNTKFLNIDNSIKCGIPVFGHKIHHLKEGLTLGQNISVIKNAYPYPTNTICHEIIHTYQRLEWSNINYYFNTYKNFENYKFIHNDLSAFDIIYFIQNKSIGYSKNFFENEAFYYAHFINATN